MLEPRGTGWTQHWTGYGPFEPFQTAYYPILTVKVVQSLRFVTRELDKTSSARKDSCGD